MRSRLSAVLVAVFALSATARADVSSDAKKAPSGAYTVETRHSQVLWAIPHLGITDFYGRFEKLSGTMSYNSGAPEKSSVNITIQMSSLTTPNGPLSTELMSNEVFDAQQFPTATFKSTSIERTSPTTGKITGELTIKNVAKPVTLDVTFNGGTPDPMNGAYDVGFHATATVKRSDFGLTGMVWESFVGDNVKLVIEALFTQQKS